MADKMTGALFARMTADEKIGLMRTMMTVCLTDILKNLSAEEKQRMVGHGWHGLLLDTPTFRACDDADDDVRFRQHDDQSGWPDGRDIRELAEEFHLSIVRLTCTARLESMPALRRKFEAVE